VKPPRAHHWLFWDVDPSQLELTADRDYILARVLEFGRLDDVKWVLSCYGMDGVHTFLRDRGHPELSRRTLTFWRVVLNAKQERWATSRRSRETNVAPWRA
jgi:squalene cyclase